MLLSASWLSSTGKREQTLSQGGIAMAARIDPLLYRQEGGGLFRRVREMTDAMMQKHPGRPVVLLGVGDVTQPLAPAIIKAVHEAADHQADKKTFHGYFGQLPALVNGIIEKDYAARGVSIKPNEVFISVGSGSDINAVSTIFAREAEVLIPDPTYPAYVDINTLLGHKIHYVPCLEENGFVPKPPDFAVDVVYLCSPNNPTGATMTKADMEEWVVYAKKYGAVIIMDSAYETFIQDPSLPKSIYEAEGALDVAIEIRSFSKTAGFTGMRCGYTVIPSTVMAVADGEPVSVRAMFSKRRAGTPGYPIQYAAAAYYSDEGYAQCMDNTLYYLNNGKVIRSILQAVNVECIGGYNSPYIWFKVPDGYGSWEFLEILLDRHGVVMTPGAGFGSSGEGWMRISCFGDAAETKRGIELVAQLCEELSKK